MVPWDQPTSIVLFFPFPWKYSCICEVRKHIRKLRSKPANTAPRAVSVVLLAHMSFDSCLKSVYSHPIWPFLVPFSSYCLTSAPLPLSVAAFFPPPALSATLFLSDLSSVKSCLPPIPNYAPSFNGCDLEKERDRGSCLLREILPNKQEKIRKESKGWQSCAVYVWVRLKTRHPECIWIVYIRHLFEVDDKWRFFLQQWIRC